MKIFLSTPLNLMISFFFLLFSSEKFGNNIQFGTINEDIQKGIEKHIDEQVHLGGGYFKLQFKEKLLHLRLVRVHTEYLSKLSAESFFACVDLADISGDLYDVDFFLKGDEKNMKVYKTMVHKLNGQPYYVWKQKDDGNWETIPVEKASLKELGVILKTDEFDFLYKVILPEINRKGRIWLPFPSKDNFQNVIIKSINLTKKPIVLKDKRNGNQVFFLELDKSHSLKTIEILYHVIRKEKSVWKDTSVDIKKYLKPDILVPINQKFTNIASMIVKNKKDDLMRARAIYDYIIDNMRYIRYGEGWGKGDAIYACDVKTGNCSDYHSFFIALTRAVGIPSRFAAGVAIPSERNEGGIEGYHCWAEFYVDGKWWPIDISEADKYSSLATYYFGHNPANRFEFSKGRDLIVEPQPISGHINFLAYPVAEIDGKTKKVKCEFYFKRSVK